MNVKIDKMFLWKTQRYIQISQGRKEQNEKIYSMFTDWSNGGKHAYRMWRKQFKIRKYARSKGR